MINWTYVQSNEGLKLSERPVCWAVELSSGCHKLASPPTLITPNALVWVLMGPDRGFVVESRERFPLGRSAPGLSDFTCTTAPIVLSEFEKTIVGRELVE
jgi:hypothetical protein